MFGELARAKVELLVDVRAVAASRRPGFSKRQLAAGLDEHGIGYLHLRALGTPKEGRLAARAGNRAELFRAFEEHLKTPQAGGDPVVDFARKHQLPKTRRDCRDLLADREIDVVDICTPPMLHATMIVAAAQAGKHVICEKPFAGYFGRDGDKSPIGRNVPKSLMYERVMEEMDKTCAAVKSSGRLFMYAEDWVYAPAVTKAVEILNATKDKILFMKAEESHTGPHA